MNSLAYLFRMRPWQHKIAGLRVAAYPLLGYVLSAEVSLVPQAAHFLAVIGLLMACYALNDYYDWKILGESNYQASRIEQGGMTPRQAWLWSWSPLILAVGLLWVGSAMVLMLYALLFILVIGYSVPPFRFKHRRGLGVVTPPLGVGVVVLQSYLITGSFSSLIGLFIIIVFLFQLYLELMHILEDATIEEEFVKLETGLAWRLLRALPLVSLLLAAALSLYHPIFLITVLASTVRVVSLRGTEQQDILRLRRSIWLPQWSLYEFALYGVAGILGVFSV